MNKKWLASALLPFVGALLFMLALSGCRGAQSQSPAPPEADFEFREGGRLFLSSCSPCHGEAGRGDGAYLSAGAAAAPPDFAADGVRERIRKELLIMRLGSTQPSGEAHCPPWGNTFSQEEIQALATFVESLVRLADTSERVEPPAPQGSS